MAEQSEEQQKLLAIKAAVGQTIHTPGWAYIKGVWANIIENAIQDTLKEDDSVKAESKRQRARALQQGLKELFAAIDGSQQVAEEQAIDWYAELGIETMKPTSDEEEQIEIEQ